MEKILHKSVVLGTFLVMHLNGHASHYLNEAKYAQAQWVQTYKNMGLEPWIHVDFDQSMELEKYSRSILMTSKITGLDGNLLLHFFRGLYNKNNLSNIFPSKELKIPKIIHQVWLGGVVPECFKDLMQSWINSHLDGWQYILWTDKEAEDFQMHSREFYDQADNYGVKSDILKMEVIYKYGGVYIDTDFECLRPLDILHYTYDFYIGITLIATDF